MANFSIDKRFTVDECETIARLHEASGAGRMSPHANSPTRELVWSSLRRIGSFLPPEARRAVLAVMKRTSERRSPPMSLTEFCKLAADLTGTSLTYETDGTVVRW